MMKGNANKLFLFLVFLLSGSIVHAADSLLIRNCYVPMPGWWNKADITIPDSVTSRELLDQYADLFFDDTTNGRRSFIKIYFIGSQKLALFPSYVGDACYHATRYDEAIAVYYSALKCCVNEKGRSDEWECYLYGMIGKCLEEKKDMEAALIWYRKAIDPRFEKGNETTKSNYKIALCFYRCLMNIRCDN